MIRNISLMTLPDIDQTLGDIAMVSGITMEAAMDKVLSRVNPYIDDIFRTEANNLLVELQAKQQPRCLEVKIG